jgi:hypothetical protein
MFIDKKKLDIVQELWYCNQCKIYHNLRIFIKLKQTKYWIKELFLCEKCLKNNRKDYKKENNHKLWIYLKSIKYECKNYKY